MAEMPETPPFPGLKEWLIVQGWKEYHDAISEGRELMGASPRELAIYREMESNPAARQELLNYFAARDNYAAMPHIGQGDGVVHQNPADSCLEDAELLTSLGGEMGLFGALGRYPHEAERQLAVAEFMDGLVNMALAHGDAINIGKHLIYQEHQQYEHGPPQPWYARPPMDFPGFGTPGRESHAHPGAGNAGHVNPPAHAENPVPVFHPSEANYSAHDGQQLHVDAAGQHGDTSVPVFHPSEANYSAHDGQQLHVDAPEQAQDLSSHDGSGFDATGADGGGGT